MSLRARLSLGFYAALLVTLADVLLSLYLLVTGYGGWAGALLNLVMSLAVGIAAVWAEQRVCGQHRAHHW